MKILTIVITFAAMMALQSCAVGSATAAYALQARTADSLSAKAEYMIIRKAKQEMINELEGK